MRSQLGRALVCALGFIFVVASASAQDSVPAADAENSGNLWFVELAGKPIADGNSASKVDSEKKAFRKAAATAGVQYKERRAFDVLFNGFTVEIDAKNRAALGAVPGVKAVWPVEIIQAPAFDPTVLSEPDLSTAIVMTGADVVQNSLGLTGEGIRVAVMDTGIDYDHPDFGGDGVARQNSSHFPNSRVVAGWDFVGDDYDAGTNPVTSPDPYPDDCGGHGSHVAGIVGSSGTSTGVAPGVSLGAYRVFGCAGSTNADIMLAAMERALKDGMHVLNMSIGSRAQWPNYPTGAAATRLLKKGMIVVASTGNNGPGGSAPDGPYAAGAPGTGHDVIATASYDNTHITQPAFELNPGMALIGYNTASGAPIPPASGTFDLAKTGTPASTADGCAPADFAGFPAGHIALVRRGGCTFYIKASNAQNGGAIGVVLYNNAAGALNPTVVGDPPITIPVVAVLAADGAVMDATIAGGGATLTWGAGIATVPNATGGLISSFSSFGMAADLTLKPDIGAPGGSIYSTIPIEQGAYGLNSGTSMASPHVAGAVALLLEADPSIPLDEVRARLQNSAKPTNWSGNPALGFLDYAHRQGAGLLDIEDSILASVDVFPGKLSLGESEAGPQTRTLTIVNRGDSDVTLDLSNILALATGPKSTTNYASVTTFAAAATVEFSATSVTVFAGDSETVDVTITAPATPLLGQYGGFIVLTEQGGGPVYRVPYAGFIGDYQAVPVLTPTSSGFPWLATLSGTTYTNQPLGATYTLVGGDTPRFLVHLDHQSRRYEFQIFNADTGQPVHPVFYRFDEADYVGRNTTATSFFAFEWDGTRIHSAGNSNLRKPVPDGTYTIVLRVLKALGDPANDAHWETWTSPPVTLDRP